MEKFLYTVSQPSTGSMGVQSLPLGLHIRDDEQVSYIRVTPVNISSHYYGTRPLRYDGGRKRGCSTKFATETDSIYYCHANNLGSKLGVVSSLENLLPVAYATQ